MAALQRWLVRRGISDAAGVKAALALGVVECLPLLAKSYVGTVLTGTEIRCTVSGLIKKRVVRGRFPRSVVCARHTGPCH